MKIKKILKIMGMSSILLVVLSVTLPVVCSYGAVFGRITNMELDDQGRVTKLTVVTKDGKMKEINVNPDLFSRETHKRLKDAYHSGKFVSLDCAISIDGGLWLRCVWIYRASASGYHMEYCASYWMYDWHSGTS